METASTKRPQRWDEPFGEMTDDLVDQILAITPFRDMHADSFPERLPLKEIIRNDSRVVEFEEGDIVLREGDYGNSAFLVLDGIVQVVLNSLPEKLLGRASPRKRGWFQAIAQLWSNHSASEVRKSANAIGGSIGTRRTGESTRIFLQDVNSVLNEDHVADVGQGELFGELAALSRSPRTATVIARGKVRLLEIRWQGLREIIRYDPGLKQYIDELYRENSLLVHLRETSFLNHLGQDELQSVADAASFQSFGEFDWQHQFRRINREEISKRIAHEPVIVNEGDYVNQLVLIRNGFARLSRKVGAGHQTYAYLGKGETYGLREILQINRSGQDVPYDFSLRAVGHVETISIPVSVIEELVLPELSEDLAQEILSANWMASVRIPETRSDGSSEGSNQALDADDPESSIETSLIEFLGEYRFVNGTQTMLIDLDRCTRCDDCVRACANAHDNNPRFNRQGPRFGNQMVASSCMHCVDPVCMIGCPTGAIGRDMETGNILINDQTCIGCSTCANSCPYDNIQMVEISDSRGKPMLDEETSLPILKATKCDLCTDQPGGPACVRACPHDAMIRINANDSQTLNQWINR